MTGHLGRRVSGLLDGQLSAAETEAAWAHVHTCHQCRDDVEREGWVKTRLSSLSWDDRLGGSAPDHLKGALLGMPPGGSFLQPGTHPSADDSLANRPRPRRAVGGMAGMAGIAALGGGAAGAAVMGMLALGPATADVPTPDRRQQPIGQLAPGPMTPRVPIRLD